MKVMISGGGTGGHIFPALAIAEAIRRDLPDSEILFVGAKGRMEMERVPAAGYPIEGLWITGLDRQKPLRNLVFPFQLAGSLWNSYRLIRRFRPDAVVGVGGFASGPLLEMASRMRIPTLIHEQNSYAGLTNRLLAKKVDRICVAFEGMDRFFPAEKILKTGNPIRYTLLENRYSQEEARQLLGVPESGSVILSLGGSLGARTLNQMFRDQTELIRSHPEIHFIWQYGALYEEDYGQCETAELENVSPVKFIEDMGLAYSAADLVIARAGALTLAELAAIGKAAVLIPSPNVAEDHQTQNALRLTDQRAALLIPDSDAREQGLQACIRLLRQPEKMDEMQRQITEFFTPEADRKIAGEIIKLAKAG